MPDNTQISPRILPDVAGHWAVAPGAPLSHCAASDPRAELNATYGQDTAGSKVTQTSERGSVLFATRSITRVGLPRRLLRLLTAPRPG